MSKTLALEAESSNTLGWPWGRGLIPPTTSKPPERFFLRRVGQDGLYHHSLCARALKASFRTWLWENERRNLGFNETLSYMLFLARAHLDLNTFCTCFVRLHSTAGSVGPWSLQGRHIQVAIPAGA